MDKIFISFLIILVSGQLFSQKNEVDRAIYEIGKRGEAVVKILKSDIPEKNILRYISVDKVDEEYVYAYLNSTALMIIRDNDIDFQLIKSPSESFKASSDKSDFSYESYPTYNQYDSLMHSFEQDYPNLCKLYSLGTLNSGREIFAIQIGDSVNDNVDRPKFFYTSSMHGDELVGYVLMLRLINHLLSNYNQDTLVNKLVNNVEIWINPLANPDGTYFNGNNDISGAKRFNSNNIDINRNFPDPAYGDHPDGNSWQQETQIFMGFADTMNFTMSANFHGGAEVANYPWDTWSKLTADDDWWQYVCHQYADTAQEYSHSTYFIAFNDGISNGYAWYSIAGGRQDYMNYFHRCRELTLEISDVKMPSESELDPHWNYNYRSLLNYIDNINYGLSGVIKDSVTGLPLKAKVEILNHDIDSSHVYSSAEFGSYYRLIDSGYYNIKISKPGYNSKVINNIRVGKDSLSVLNATLSMDTVGIRESFKNIFKYYPTPFNSEITFKLIKVNYRNAEFIEIYNSNSILIDRINIRNKEKFTIDTENYSQGFYFFIIKSASESISRGKILKI